MQQLSQLTGGSSLVTDVDNLCHACQATEYRFYETRVRIMLLDKGDGAVIGEYHAPIEPLEVRLDQMQAVPCALV